MDRVFAPWRIEWVERADPDEEEGCVFCRLPEEDDDRENLVVARADKSYVMLNNYPYNPGHAMVVPYEHENEYESLDNETLLDHARLKQLTFRATRRAFEPDGFNTGLNLGSGSGGSVKGHLHTHVVPRWRGDTNFMPVTADTKVIVEKLEDSYEKLRAAFLEQNGVLEEGEDEAAVVNFV